MKREKVRHILRALADGIDPSTGEPISGSSPLNNVEVVRAFYSACDVLGVTGRYVKDGKRPRNAGKPWTKEAERSLLRAYDSGSSTLKLTQQFERTHASIIARLIQLGRDPGERPAE